MHLWLHFTSTVDFRAFRAFRGKRHGPDQPHLPVDLSDCNLME
jgi:hypothetical protein